MPLTAATAYIGPWTDYSKGTIYGATITVPAVHGTTIIAAAVTLVSLASIAGWELFCFIAHQVRSTTEAKDGLFHQQQILLRSRTPPLLTALRMLTLGINWRTHTRKPLLRSAPFFFYGLCTFCLFSVGGLYTSRLAVTGGEVLARGKCGFLRGSLGGVNLHSNATDVANDDVFYQASYMSFRDASAYARACYNDFAHGESFSCKIYTRPYISSTRREDGDCPFADGACLDGSVTFDTGVFSSRDLGINSRVSDEVRMRKKMTCAPVNAEKYTSGWTTEVRPGSVYVESQAVPVPGDVYKYYDLGSTLLPDGISMVNFSTIVSNTTAIRQPVAYHLNYLDHNPGHNKSYLPHPDFALPDADLTLLLLTSNAYYTNPVTDTWFKATEPNNIEGYVLYPSDEILTVIGCTEQYQVCNDGRCSELNSLGAIFGLEDAGLGFNKLQHTIYQLLSIYTSFTPISLNLQYLRNELLLANQLLYGAALVSSSPEDGHWKQEMANMHNISLAGLQAHGLLHAAPAQTAVNTNFNLHDFIMEETTPENIELCKNQMFRSPAHTSFSTLALSLIAAVCSIIILLNTTLPSIVLWVQERVIRVEGVSNRRMIAWFEDDVLQQQRAALEAKGLGPWRGRNKTVPVLDRFGELWQASRYVDHGAVPQDLGHVEQISVGGLDSKKA